MRTRGRADEDLSLVALLVIDLRLLAGEALRAPPQVRGRHTERPARGAAAAEHYHSVGQEGVAVLAERGAHTDRACGSRLWLDRTPTTLVPSVPMAGAYLGVQPGAGSGRNGGPSGDTGELR